jgi:hypothetical protein
LGPEWIKKDLETHAEAYAKFIVEKLRMPAILPMRESSR